MKTNSIQTKVGGININNVEGMKKLVDDMNLASEDESLSQIGFRLRAISNIEGKATIVDLSEHIEISFDKPVYEKDLIKIVNEYKDKYELYLPTEELKQDKINKQDNEKIVDSSKNFEETKEKKSLNGNDLIEMIGLYKIYLSKQENLKDFKDIQIEVVPYEMLKLQLPDSIENIFEPTDPRVFKNIELIRAKYNGDLIIHKDLVLR